MSGQINFKHVTAMQRFSLVGEQELFEKYGTDDRRRTIDLFQLLARCGDDVLGIGDRQTLLTALDALSAIGYKREDLQDGEVPVREVGLEDSYTGTELEIFAKAMHFSKDRVGDRALVMRSVYGQRWIEIAADCGVTSRKAMSAAKAAAGVLVRGYYASALTGCGETDAVLPRIIFGLYGDKDKKINAEIERFYAHENSCGACASLRTHLSRALTLMAVVMPPRDLTAEQSAEIARGDSLGSAVAADFDRLTGLEVQQLTGAEAAGEAITEVLPVQESSALDQVAEEERERELGEIAHAQAEVAPWPSDVFLIDEPGLADVGSVSAESILASEEAAELARVVVAEEPAVDAPAAAGTLGFVDPGPAPPIDLAAFEEEEMLNDHDEDGDDLDLYASMAILETVIDPSIVVPALIRSEELAEEPPAPIEVFDWEGENEQLGHEPLAAELEQAVVHEVEPIPVAFAAPKVQAEVVPLDVPSAPETTSDSEANHLDRAEAIDFAEHDVPVALLLDLATEDDAERLGSVRPPIVVEGPGRPMSVRENGSGARAVFVTKPVARMAAAESALSRWAKAGEQDDFDYAARDEQKDSRRKVAGVLLAAFAALLLMAGVTLEGAGKNEPPATAAPGPAAPANQVAEKPKPKKQKRKKHPKKAKAAQPAPQPTTTYVPTSAPVNSAPAPSSSSSPGADDGSTEFLPEERG